MSKVTRIINFNNCKLCKEEVRRLLNMAEKDMKVKMTLKSDIEDNGEYHITTLEEIKGGDEDDK